MPTTVVKYRIFIASPSGLDEIRRSFRDLLDEYSRTESLPRGVLFEAVGWEATLPGIGRPQALINDEIRTCDRAVFVFRDRWGSPPGEGSGYTSGCEEEWELCNSLVGSGDMQSVQLFFLRVTDAQLKDPGDQLKALLAFRQKILDGRRHLMKELKLDAEFLAELRAALAHWLRQHEKAHRPAGEERAGDESTVRQFPESPSMPASATSQNGIAARLLSRAVELLRENAAVSALPIIEAALDTNPPADICARALVAKGYSLGTLGRSEEEIAVYDDLLARFSNASEAAFREQVASGLFNKGFKLGALGRSDDAIAVYDDLLARFGNASEVALREQVAKGLFNKGFTLGTLGRSEDEIAVYDDLLVRFGSASEVALREQVAKGLSQQGLHTRRARPQRGRDRRRRRPARALRQCQRGGASRGGRQGASQHRHHGRRAWSRRGGDRRLRRPARAIWQCQ